MSSPFFALLFLFVAFAKNNGSFPPLFVTLLVVTLPTFLFFIKPGISRAKFVNKIIYEAQVIDKNTLQLKTFSSFWLKEKIFLVNPNEISIKENPIEKKLYGKLDLSKISIDLNEKYILKEVLDKLEIQNS